MANTSMLFFVMIEFSRFFRGGKKTCWLYYCAPSDELIPTVLIIIFILML